MSTHYNISSAVYSLQLETATLDAKIVALRYLKYHLASNESLSVYDRKRINQLILNTILTMILSEDRSSNVRKQQLVRTELFVILASLLNSNTLFGDILSNPDLIAKNRLSALQSLTAAQSLDLDESSQPIHSHGSNQVAEWDELGGMTGARRSAKHASLAASTSDKKQGFKPSEALKIIPAMTANATPKVNLLRSSILKQQGRRLLSKSLRPRPSVLFSDKMELDSFVPGADPHNFIEQDRKLGYQKPRMWFPGAGVEIDASLLPADRMGGAKKSATDQVVEEYLQMRALASYVGDLVTPFSPVKGVSSGQHSKRKVDMLEPLGDGPDEVKTVRLSGFTEPGRFDAAMNEAVAIWSPLLGIHLPSGLRAGTARGAHKTFHTAKKVVPFRYLHELQRLQEEESAASTDNYDDTRIGELDMVSLGESSLSVSQSSLHISPYMATGSIGPGRSVILF